jgi:hypothetical protein
MLKKPRRLRRVPFSPGRCFHPFSVLKEQDARQCIENFLMRTAREVIMPASVCLSMVLGGCGGAAGSVDSLPPLPDATAYSCTCSPDSCGNASSPGSCSCTYLAGSFTGTCSPDSCGGASLASSCSCNCSTASCGCLCQVECVPEPNYADGRDSGPTPYCGDGIVDTNQGEECDLGKLNGVCLDASGNPPDGGQGYPGDAGCPEDTQIYCTMSCQIPLGEDS